MDKYEMDCLDFGDACCEEMWMALSIYADGEADEAEREQVQAHVATCAGCARELEILTQSSMLLASAPELMPPAELRESILAATINRRGILARATDAIRRTLAPAPARYGAVAAAGALAALAFFGQRSGPANQQPPRKALAFVPPASRNDEQPGTSTPNSLVIEPPILPEIRLPVRSRSNTVVALENASLRTRAHESAPLLPVPSAVKRPAAKKATPSNDPQPEVATQPMPEKPNSTEPDMGDKPASPVPTMVTANMVDPMPTVAKHDTEAPVPPAAPVATRISLVEASAPLGSSNIASLASLKQSLKQQKMDWNTRDIRDKIRDKQIRVDIFKGSF